jgi:hypothetical protein
MTIQTIEKTAIQAMATSKARRKVAVEFIINEGKEEKKERKRSAKYKSWEEAKKAKARQDLEASRRRDARRKKLDILMKLDVNKGMIGYLVYKGYKVTDKHKEYLMDIIDEIKKYSNK